MRFTGRLVGSILVAGLALGLPAGRAGSQAGSAQGAALVVNEVQYDPPGAGNDSGYEWVELYNGGGEPVGLAGWQLADARDAVALPEVAVAPGEFLVLAAGAGFAEQHPGFTGRLVVLGGRIGNGLGNSGDQVRLLAPDGRLVDGLSYGDDAGLLDPAAPDVAAEHSLERVPAGRDTDTAADWVDQPVPSPGRSGADTAPTAVPATAPPPTVGPEARLVLNEYLPAPRDIDWDGDGQATTADEWVELFNAGTVPIAMRGWQLDDVADGGSAPYVLPDGAVLPPGGHLVVFAKDSKLQLNNGGDDLRLLSADGTVRDATSYSRSVPDGAIARLGDGTGPWTDGLPPSPGRPNPGEAPTPGPSSTPGSTPVAGPSATPGSGPTATPAGPGPTPPTPGGPGTPPPVLLPLLLLSEVLADPLRAGDDAAEEWLELFNPGQAPVRLAGWSIGDGQAWDALPEGLVPPRGFVLVAGGRAQAAAFRSEGLTALAVADGRLGNGLANRGDVVRLRGPTGTVVDALSYGENLAAFDPAVPLGPPGSSLERLPPDTDTDTAEDWWPQPAPAPGRAGDRPGGPPQVRLNEVLPAPGRVDWDGDGLASHEDEWVELINLSGDPVDLADWRLEVGPAGDAGWDWRFPRPWRLAPGALGLVHRSTSALALVNAGDAVRLRRADGVLADSLSWDGSPGYDRAIGRLPDGTGAWVAGLPGTPGQPNRAAEARPMTAREPAGERAPEAAAERALSAARDGPPGARVRVRGQVTLPPGPLGGRTAYLGDAAAGLRLYLAQRAATLPGWVEGERVTAVGRLDDYRGERQLVVERLADLSSEGPAPALPPHPVRAADVSPARAEALEGRLVRLVGRVTVSRPASFVVDDGSGAVQVSVPAASGVRRPALRLGDVRSVVGVVSQSASGAPWIGGWRLLVRGPADIGPPGRMSAGRGGLPRSWPSRLGAPAGRRRHGAGLGLATRCALQ
jgi:hypothetical protein